MQTYAPRQSHNGTFPESTARVEADVVLSRQGQRLLLETHSDLSWLGPILAIRFHAANCDEHGGGVIATHPIPLLAFHPQLDKYNGRVSQQTAYSCPLGLLPVVKQLLDERRLRYDERRVQPLRLPKQDRVSFPFDEPAVDQAWLDMVQKTDRGLVRYRRGGVRLAWLIAQVARAWRDKSVMVWTRSLREAKQLTQDLREHSISAAWDNGTADFETSPQVLLGTVEFFGRDADVQKRQIAIATDASRVFSHGGSYALKHAYVARMYGMLPDDRALTPAEEDVVRAAFGFNELRIPEHGSVWEPASVHTIKYHPRNPASRSLHAALEVKRQLIWNNAPRNDFVAELVRAMTSGKPEDGMIPAGLREFLLDTESLRVAVLVENMEHANALKTVLDDARVVTANTIQPHDPWKRDGIVIVTRLALPALHNRNVLVRADASPDGLDLLNSYGHACVVDVQDPHHPLLGRWTRSRRDDYRRLGWAINGQVVRDTVGDFLASHKVEVGL